MQYDQDVSVRKFQTRAAPGHPTIAMSMPVLR